MGVNWFRQGAVSREMTIRQAIAVNEALQVNANDDAYAVRLAA